MRLIGIENFASLESDPESSGASWEGFVIEQILGRIGDRHAYFWATHGGAELDLLFIKGGKKFGVEVKYADAPTMTRSMHIDSLDDLKLEHLWVDLSRCTAEYKLHDRVTVYAVAAVSALKSFQTKRSGRSSYTPPHDRIVRN